MQLFKADSRMRAALCIASETLRRVEGSLGSSLVAKWYSEPTDAGKFAVSSVHVCADASDLEFGSILRLEDTHRQSQPAGRSLPGLSVFKSRSEDGV